MDSAPIRGESFSGELREPLGRVHLDNENQTASVTQVDSSAGGGRGAAQSPPKRSRWRRGSININTPSIEAIVIDELPELGTSEAIGAAGMTVEQETVRDASSSAEARAVTTSFRVQRMNADFEVSRGRPNVQRFVRPEAVESQWERHPVADDSQHPQATSAPGVERRPRRGESILILRGAFSELILSGHKTLEIRHMKLASKEYWIGTGGVVLGRASFVLQERIETRDRWMELRSEHRWDVHDLPYDRTYAFRISDVVTLNEPVLYDKPPGAIGICKFRPVGRVNDQ